MIIHILLCINLSKGFGIGFSGQCRGFFLLHESRKISRIEADSDKIVRLSTFLSTIVWIKEQYWG